MKFFRRIFLFLLINLAVIALLITITSVFGIEPYLTPYGLNLQSLAIYAAIIGFSGAFISLLLSRWLVRQTLKIRILKSPQSTAESNLIQIIERIARQKNIRTPQIGVYQSPEVNAFATGPSKNRSLVAVSSALLDQFSSQELEGVLAHEMAHISNGDMVTMTLLQGVLNTFVIFLARAGAYALQRGSGRGEVGGLAYWGLSIALEIVFGMLALLILMAFSRHREFRADFSGAQTVGKQSMLSALRRLQTMQPRARDPRQPSSLRAFKISDRPRRWAHAFASHPSLQKRIERLEQAPIS
ncbi:MAG: protease HtpX [Candidatus Gracilibacteria bacterium]|nr:protease HtpX [Candidatus Gracilibacteria bacterium]